MRQTGWTRVGVALACAGMAALLLLPPVLGASKYDKFLGKIREEDASGAPSTNDSEVIWAGTNIFRKPVIIAETWTAATNTLEVDGSTLLGGAVTLGGNVLLEGNFISNDGDSEGISVDDDGNVLVSSGSGGDFAVERGKKIILDSNGESHTYINESEDNLMQFMVEGVDMLQLERVGQASATINVAEDDVDFVVNWDNGQATFEGSSGNLMLAGDLEIPATAKATLDGDGGNTYLTETSTDLLKFYVGGIEFGYFDQETAQKAIAWNNGQEDIDIYWKTASIDSWVESSSGYWGIGALTSPNAVLDVNGSFGAAINTVTVDDTTLNANYFTVLINASAGDVNVNLPAASGCEGRVYIIKAIDVSNTASVTPNGSDEIDGTTGQRNIGTQYHGIIIQSNGTHWFILAEID